MWKHDYNSTNIKKCIVGTRLKNIYSRTSSTRAVGERMGMEGGGGGSFLLISFPTPSPESVCTTLHNVCVIHLNGCIACFLDICVHHYSRQRLILSLLFPCVHWRHALNFCLPYQLISKETNSFTYKHWNLKVNLQS